MGKCCKKLTEYKAYEKCVSVTFTETSGSGMTFVMCFYFTAIKKLNCIVQWVGYQNLTISNFASATPKVLEFSGNFSVSNCSCFTPKGTITYFKAPVEYTLSTSTPTDLIHYGEFGFNSGGNLTLKFTQAADFANTNVINIGAGGACYVV